MLECLVDGEVSRYVPANDRGLAYGDGLFETVLVDDGVPCLWQEHMNRLADGCDRLGIGMPPQDVLVRETRTAAAGRKRCVVKIVLTRGSGGRGYAPPTAAVTRRIVSAHEFRSDHDAARDSGIEARICSLRLAMQPAYGGIKHLNRLEQVLAMREVADYPEQEGILLNQDGFVISAISANLFLVSGTVMLTPRMDRCGVRGILRRLILRDFKARCELRRVSVAMMGEADEVFLCNSVRGIIPVTRIDDNRWPVGPVTRELQGWFERCSRGP